MFKSKTFMAQTKMYIHIITYCVQVILFDLYIRKSNNIYYSQELHFLPLIDDEEIHDHDVTIELRFQTLTTYLQT